MKNKVIKVQVVYKDPNNNYTTQQYTLLLYFKQQNMSYVCVSYVSTKTNFLQVYFQARQCILVYRFNFIQTNKNPLTYRALNRFDA